MKVKVNLGLHSTSDADAIIDGRQIVQKMTGNANFGLATNPINPPLLTVSKAIDDVEAASTAAQDASTAATRNLYQKRHVYDTLVTKLSHYVEDTANDPAITDDKREGIVVSAGMTIKIKTPRQKQHFEARNTDLSGTVRLIAEGIARCAHEWNYTPDVVNFTNRIAIDSTTTAHTDVHGLVSGAKYAFFHKQIIAGAKSDWEGPVILPVT